MNNNEVLKKLRVALQLRDDQIADILKLVDFRMEKSELNAFFRNQDHPNYMDCGDQVLRNFLNGLIIHLRGTKENPKNPSEVIAENRMNLGKSKATTTILKKESNAKSSSKSKPFKSQNKKTATKVSVVEKVRYKNGKDSK